MKPVLQALVVAEHVYQAIDGKKIIAGTFNQVRFKKSPPSMEEEKPDGPKRESALIGVDLGCPCAYASLTDVVDGAEVVLQFVDLGKNRVLFKSETLTLRSQDRLKPIEIIAPLPRLPINEAGTFALELVCEGEILGSYRIIADEIK